MADSSERYVLLNELADEFAARARAGERPTLDEYCARCPDLANDIRELFPAMVALEDANAAAAPEPALPAALEVLGDFRLIRELGRGGMGVVFEAEQISLGRQVALKLLTQRLLRDAKQKRRFEREARSTAQLHHTNIVPVFGFGEHDGTPYYVMQYIRGQPLDAVVREVALLEGGVAECVTEELSQAARSLHGGTAAPAPRSPAETASDSSVRPASSPRGGDVSGVTSVTMAAPEAGRPQRRLNYWQGVARIGVQAAQALEYAHQQGVVHRDIKPSNLLLDAAGTVWVTDFGLAKAETADNLTGTGDVLGTLRYMAPEALDGGTNARSDVFSLGLTLYELLALRPAYGQRERSVLVKQVAEAKPTPLRTVRPAAPFDLETIVHKALEREPGRRYATAGEFAADLQRFLDDEPIRARRQTAAEAAWRWARQHKAVASLLSMVAALLVALTLGALAAAAHFRRQESDQRGLANVKAALAERNAQLAEENEAAKKSALTAQAQAESVVWDMQTARGLLAAGQDDPARAALWFATAARQAGDDRERRAASLLRARNWLAEAPAPQSALHVNGPLRRMEFHPSEPLLALVSPDGGLALFDWRGGRVLTWPADCKQALDARFSPDGATIAVALPHGVELRRAKDGAVVRSIAGAARCLAFSADGAKLAIGGAGARVHAAKDGAALTPVLAHPQAVVALAFDQAGARIATAAADGMARVYAVAAGADQPLFPAVPHLPKKPTPPFFMKGGAQLASLEANGDVTFTEVPGGKRVRRVVCGLAPFARMPVLAGPEDGAWVATGGGFASKILHGPDAERPPIDIKHTIWNMDLAASADGAILVTGSWDYTARVWSSLDGKPIGSPLPHTGVVDQVAVARDRATLATYSAGIVRVWRLGRPSVARVSEEPWHWNARPSFDGAHLVPGLNHEFGWVPPPAGGALAAVDPRSVATARSIGPNLPCRGGAVDSCFLADHRTVATVSQDGPRGWLEFHDARTAKRLGEAVPLPAPPLSVAARPGRAEAAALCRDGTLVVAAGGVRRFAAKVEEWGSPIHNNYFGRVLYAGDGGSLLTINAPGTRFGLRDAETGAARCPPVNPILSGGPIRSVAAAPDGRYFATAVNGANAAQVWDARTGKPLSKPLPHQGDEYGIWHLCFTPNGERLLTACIDRQALVWDWRRGTLDGPPMKHPEQVYRVETTADGRYAVTVAREQPATLRVWELASNREVAPPQRFGPPGLRPFYCSLARAGDGPWWLAGPGPNLARFDLSRVLAPAADTLEAATLAAELASGMRIESGDERTLTAEEWLARLTRLRSLPPTAP